MNNFNGYEMAIREMEDRLKTALGELNKTRNMLRQFVEAVDGSHAQVMATYHQAKQLLAQIEGEAK